MALARVSHWRIPYHVSDLFFLGWDEKRWKSGDVMCGSPPHPIIAPKKENREKNVDIFLVYLSM